MDAAGVRVLNAGGEMVNRVCVVGLGSAW